MIRVIDIQRLLGRVRYKPNTKFTADRIDRHDILIHISQNVVDVRPPHGMTFVRASYKLDESELRSMSEREFFDRLYDEIKRQEEHEQREWMTVDGVCVVEPHPENPGGQPWRRKEAPRPVPAMPFGREYMFYEEPAPFNEVRWKALLAMTMPDPRSLVKYIDSGSTSQEDADE